MANDWEALTKQVKEANDIVDVIGGYITLQPAGGKFKGLCPFHDDHRPSFVVDPHWQNYRCWACGKFGDVFTFIQEKERVDFREARELLARRAGISLEKIADSPHNRGRAFMLDVMRWSQEQYQKCLREAPFAGEARRYLQERKLALDTIERFGLGYAPQAGDWLVKEAARAQIATDVLEQVGLLAPRTEGRGYYDRFRDRIMFPIRNLRGQTVGFGGRIVPSSPFASRAPKYYNSADTPLFTKSEQLYGLDLARQACVSRNINYLAVVEGYTDVLMAHQMGIPQVVATMGTALNARHVQHLRRHVPRVVLVFDADAGGHTGVDRALELFVSQEVDLAIATLPEGLDPCDLLVQQGPEPLLAALDQAVDALEFKLNQLVARAEVARSLEGRRRAVDEVLRIIALAPAMTGQAGQLKRELMIGRIGQRFGVKEETLWARLQELRQKPAAPASRNRPVPVAPAEGPAPPHERQLLEVLLAEPALVAVAQKEIKPEELEHPGLRKLLNGLYALQARGLSPELDSLRSELDHTRLLEHALRLQEKGRAEANRAGWLQQLLAEFRRRRQVRRNQQVQDQLHAAANNHQAALELLRQLQEQRDLVAD